MNDKIIYVFDFDGTLVKQTRFQTIAQNYKDFLEFDVFINPGAFNVEWQILSSRPAQDLWLLDHVIHRFNLKPTQITVMDSDDPKYNSEQEFNWKLYHLSQLKLKNPDKLIIYVDNSICHRDWLSKHNIQCMSVMNFICHCTITDSDGNFI